MEGFVEVAVRAVAVHPPEGDPVLLLEWAEGARVLPIWIDPGDYRHLVIDGAMPAPHRPGGVDALADLLAELGGAVARAEITGCHEGVFIAALVVSGVGAGEIALDLRVSEAVAACVAAEAPILVDRQVLDSVGVAAALLDGGRDDVAAGREQQESVDEFRRFLEEVDAGDFLAAELGDDDAPEADDGDGGDVTGGRRDPGESPGE